MSTHPIAQLSGLPFPEQLPTIEALIARDQELDALLTTLGAQPDHEPLAHAVRAMGRAHKLDAVRGTLTQLLSQLPDTGVQRTLATRCVVILPSRITCRVW